MVIMCIAYPTTGSVKHQTHNLDRSQPLALGNRDLGELVQVVVGSLLDGDQAVVCL